MSEPLAIRITAEFNVLLTRISILFLAKRGGKDSNLRAPKGATSLAGKRIQPDSATAANSSVVQYCLITTEYKQILTSIIFCLSEIIIVAFSLAGRRGIEPLGMRFGVSP